MAERALLRRYMTALARADSRVIASLFHEDLRVTMPMWAPCTAGARGSAWFERQSFVADLAKVLDPDSPDYLGAWRSVPIGANRQPAVAHYVRRPGDGVFRALVLEVLRVDGKRITEIVSFGPGMFRAFGLAPTR